MPGCGQCRNWALNSAGIRGPELRSGVETIAEALLRHDLKAAQRVRVAFLEMRPGLLLELVEPEDRESPVGGLLKKGVGFYHLGFKTGEFDRTLERLEAAGHRSLGVRHRSLGVFPSGAFTMRRCVFLVSPLGHLIELIEADQSA